MLKTIEVHIFVETRKHLHFYNNLKVFTVTIDQLLRILIFLGTDRETVSQGKQTVGKPFIDGAALPCGSSRAWAGNKH